MPNFIEIRRVVSVMKDADGKTSALCVHCKNCVKIRYLNMIAQYVNWLQETLLLKYEFI